jgi:hypothetical protein
MRMSACLVMWVEMWEMENGKEKMWADVVYDYIGVFFIKHIYK